MIRRFSPVLLIAALAVSGCGYEPPPETNTASPAYGSDLKTCKSTAGETVAKQNVKRFPTWVFSPVTRWGQADTAVQTCMASKGYGRLRWCTPDELRGGTKTGGVIVTSSGVQCSDPPAPDHRRS